MEECYNNEDPVDKSFTSRRGEEPADKKRLQTPKCYEQTFIPEIPDYHNFLNIQIRGYQTIMTKFLIQNFPSLHLKIQKNSI